MPDEQEPAWAKSRCITGHFCTRHLLLSSYDFHHRVGNKEANISQMLNHNLPFEIIRRELEKCRVLCANCHRELHQLRI